jgi:hypothetical protein
MSASGAADPAIGLAITAGVGMTHLGPGLAPGMGEAEAFERLNAWGVARDGELVDLRASLVNTQAAVGATFAEARGTLMTIVNDFRMEAETMRSHSLYEATQNLARLDQVVAEARARFDAQDARVSQDLGELAQRVAAVPPQAALFQAAPAPAVVTSPGGTVRFFPGGPVAGMVLQPAPMAGFTTPQRPTQQQQQPQPTHPTTTTYDAWGPWAAGRGVSPQGQPPIPDAWAAAAAASAAAPQQSQQQPGELPRHSYMTPGDRPREMRLDARGWGANQPKLDIGVGFDTFQIWKDRALMFLSRERPDVRKLLSWAETQTKETLGNGLATQAAHLGIPDLAGVEYALHDGIKMTIMDTLLGRARNCVERGCELWRSLCAEWSGAAPQLQMAKAKRFQDPPTCKDMQELWSRLPAWERLGEEVASSGFVVPPWIQMVALDQLLPTQLSDALVSRASDGKELATFGARLAWVKLQMEHSRGIAQATAYAPGGGRGKDASGDVNMYSVDNPPGLGGDAVENMTWCMAEAAQAGDWGLVDSLQNSIFAMKGSKGRKGFGKGKLGKGGAAPAAVGKGGAAPADFQGACRYCDKWGHRMSECRKLTADIASGKAVGKGKAGGKGGATGGKGPTAAPLAEVAAADTWAGDLLDGAIAEAAAGFEEWDFDTAICSLAAETFAVQPFSRQTSGKTAGASASARLAQTIVQPFSGKTFYKTLLGQPAGRTQTSETFSIYEQAKLGKLALRSGGVLAGTARETKTHNSFASLSLLTGDAEQLLATVSGGPRGGRVVEAVVDSGAVHSVTPPGVFPGLTVPSLWSKTGRGYRAANGTGIKNLGQVAVKFCTAEGDTCNIPFQVAEVDQPLLSVAHLTGAGNRVELGHASGRVVNLKTGRTIALERRGGVYIMKMYLADAATPAPFRRQGA